VSREAAMPPEIPNPKRQISNNLLKTKISKIFPVFGTWGLALGVFRRLFGLWNLAFGISP
jgi:hypothetical protein